MAGINRFNLRGVELNWDNATIETKMALTQMGSISFRTGTSKYDIIPAGLVDIAQVMMSHADPMVEISTPDILTVLTNLPASLSGRELYGTNSYIEFAERDNAGTFVSGGSTLDQLVFQEGVFFLNSISCQQDDPQGAQASISLHLLSTDGLVVPATFVKAATAVDAPAFVSCYYLGPTEFNNAVKTGVLGWTYNTNINFSKDRFDGEVYATKGAIVSRGATLTVRFANLEHMETGNFLANLFQGCITGTGIDLFLRRGDQCGTRIADNVTSHIQINFAEAVYDISDLSAQDNGDGSISVDFRILQAPAVSVGVVIA